MIAEILLRDVGELVVWLGAVVAALTVLVKAPPLRWLMRQLVKEPSTEWLRVQVAEVVREVLKEHPLTNGWGVKAITSIAEKTGADVEPPHQPPGS